ncbi:MAG TPA: hypothetical protein VM582_00725 [Candidatus Thermoplasmatota archaeon]|nr:hypothetical protein [Candidatus Thermoplasmatota archaeon]
MAVAWGVTGILGCVALVLALAAALWIYFARPDRFQNRIVALALATEGLYIGTSYGSAC